MAVPTTGPYGTGIRDEWNRADGDPGAGYSTILGDAYTKPTIVSNELTGWDTGGFGWSAMIDTSGSYECSEAWTTIVAFKGVSDRWAGVFARWGANFGYSALVNGNGSYELDRWDAGVKTVLDYWDSAWLPLGTIFAAGDSLALAVIDNKLELWRWPTDGTAWTRLMVVNDSTYPDPGYLGIRVSDATTDTFGGGAFVPTPTYRTSASGHLAIASDVVDWEADTFNVALLDASLRLNPYSFETFTDVASAEISGAGYTAGGLSLTGKTATGGGIGEALVLDADDSTFTGFTALWRYAVIYRPSDGLLIGYCDAKYTASNAGALTLTWPATGALHCYAPPFDPTRYLVTPFNRDARKNAADSESPGWIAKSIEMADDGFMRNFRHSNIAAEMYGMAVVTADSTDPSYTIGESEYHIVVDDPIRIPVGTLPDPSDDHHLSIYDTITGRIHDLWVAEWHFGTSTWTAGGGVSSTPPALEVETHAGVNAACLPGRAGLFMPEELADGVIPHALMCSIPKLHPTAMRFPAIHTDGKGDTADMPMGSWLSFPPDLDLESYGLDDFSLLICRTIQRFGAFVKDSGGSFAFKGRNPINEGMTWDEAATIGDVTISRSEWNAFYLPVGDATIPWEELVVLMEPFCLAVLADSEELVAMSDSDELVGMTRSL